MAELSRPVAAGAEPPGAAAEAPAAAPGAAAVRTAERRARVVAGLLFTAAAALTLHFLRTMSGGMAMPGGWTMSMMWMPMPGETALEATLVFSLMWLAMMVAMMLPSALPALLLYHRVLAFRGERAAEVRLWLAASGYFAVWVVFGLAAYGAGRALGAAAMASDAVSRAVPVLSGAALVVAGLWQLTPWKAACLRHCRSPLAIVARHLDGGARGALALGLHHGAWCAGCCWGLMTVQLAVGIMSLPAMIAVAAVIAAEKLWALGEAVAVVAGAASITAGAAIVAGSLAG